jgi:hypothetical protein
MIKFLNVKVHVPSKQVEEDDEFEDVSGLLEGDKK